MESEEISYIVIVGDPVYDIYKEDKINFINDQLSRDVIVDQSQNVILRHDVQVCSQFNQIKGEFVRSMEIVEVLSSYTNEHVKTKFQFLVMCHTTVDLKIKMMVAINYVLLFEAYYVWKSRKRIGFYVKFLSLEDFGVEDHG